MRLGLVDGVLTPDPERRLPGRGAWVHDAACAARATARKGWSRSFRNRVEVRPELLEDALPTAPDAH